MNESEYLETRVEDQIKWYDAKSNYNQKCYKLLRFIEIVAATSIPFLTGYVTDTKPVFRTVVGLLGLVIAIIAGVVSLLRFQENWIGYRTTCESIKHERYLFLTRTEPYNADEPFPLLVQRIESMISKENTTWAKYILPQKKEARNAK